MEKSKSSVIVRKKLTTRDEEVEEDEEEEEEETIRKQKKLESQSWKTSDQLRGSLSLDQNTKPGLRGGLLTRQKSKRPSVTPLHEESTWTRLRLSLESHLD
ncbi:Hypothetical predicted protein [Xyrichtys novacula]|uniref:Uncharacterized protein n=1 Tax=Xyrichtys novacula TaxID=13765 RepID=A0AAV1H9U5_XYRNO|nr:Hypothetical predicted protein [Xyrichtys novacula]